MGMASPNLLTLFIFFLFLFTANQRISTRKTNSLTINILNYAINTLNNLSKYHIKKLIQLDMLFIYKLGIYDRSVQDHGILFYQIIRGALSLLYHHFISDFDGSVYYAIGWPWCAHRRLRFVDRFCWIPISFSKKRYSWTLRDSKKSNRIFYFEYRDWMVATTMVRGKWRGFSSFQTKFNKVKYIQ